MRSPPCAPSRPRASTATRAEAHAEQLRAAAGADLEQLANKEDLARVETTLTAEMRIVKWAMAFQGAVSLATLAAVLGLAWKLLP